MHAKLPVRILIVEARYYADIADAQLAGARRVLEAAGAEREVITVPGALEIPARSPWPMRRAIMPAPPSTAYRGAWLRDPGRDHALRDCFQ
jgi:hypothetical protein